MSHVDTATRAGAQSGGTGTGHRILVIDDDQFLLSMMERFLDEAGYRVSTLNIPQQAVDEIVRQRPDAVLLDIMMPGVDGLEVCRQLREIRELDAIKIIIVSAKTYDFDRRRAKANGANGFIAKPIQRDSFLERIAAIIEDRIDLRFWGVRGTLPVPGPRSMRYGGNTNCISVGFENDRLFIFDAGTGIKPLSSHLLSLRQRVTAKMLITHPHWDHINALPFFVPLYIQGNEFEIYGSSHGTLKMQDMISAQMDGVYFPITMREFGARVTFRDLGEETLDVEGVRVSTMFLSHPGYCLGYRLDYHGRSVCYITDNELYTPDLPQYDGKYSERLATFCHGTDVLITDTNYMDEAYPTKVGWGHSPVTEVVKLAHMAQVKKLCLYHHDPDQSDDDIDRKLAVAVAKMAELGGATEVTAPAEGSRIIL
jgi:CheY-like chemotaxis protein